jgi:hypothetical protein
LGALKRVQRGACVMADEKVGRVSAPARNPTLASAASGTGGGKARSGGRPTPGKPALPRDAAGSIFTAQAPAGAARTVSAVLGEMVWLLTQSKRHAQAFFIADLEWMAMPPILLQQFRLFYAPRTSRSARSCGPT